MQYLISRLTEPSTWRGLIMLATVFGAKLRPELADSIVAAGASVVGAIEVVRKEK